MKPLRVGLLGIGTVGSGTFEVLARNQEEIRRRAGCAIEIAVVADLDTARAQITRLLQGTPITADDLTDIPVDLADCFGHAMLHCILCWGKIYLLAILARPQHLRQSAVY